jgi:hypothetical protein
MNPSRPGNESHRQQPARQATRSNRSQTAARPPWTVFPLGDDCCSEKSSYDERLPEGWRVEGLTDQFPYRHRIEHDMAVYPEGIHKWRKISVRLSTSVFGEQTAQACAIACLQHLTSELSVNHRRSLFGCFSGLGYQRTFLPRRHRKRSARAGVARSAGVDPLSSL